MIYETVHAIKNKILRRVAICAITPVLLILFVACFIVGSALCFKEPLVMAFRSCRDDLKKTYKDCVELIKETTEAFVKLWQMKEDEKSE